MALVPAPDCRAGELERCVFRMCELVCISVRIVLFIFRVGQWHTILTFILKFSLF